VERAINHVTFCWEQLCTLCPKCLHSSRLHQSTRNNMKHTGCSHRSCFVTTRWITISLAIVCPVGILYYRTITGKHPHFSWRIVSAIKWPIALWHFKNNRFCLKLICGTSPLFCLGDAEGQKGEAIPIQAWTRPEGSSKLRLANFTPIGTWMR
jgi:hypothetical protein